MESDLAERLGVSRTPVRSALQQLHQEGYILVSGKGKQARMSIAPLTEQDALDLYGIIGMIEALAASWAAGLAAGPRAELVAELRRLNADLLALSSNDELDSEAVFHLRTEFHWQFVQASRQPRLIAIHEAIKPQADRYRRLYLSTVSPAEVRELVRAQEAITEGVEAGDPEAAERAVRASWTEASAGLSKLIRRWGEQGSW